MKSQSQIIQKPVNISFSSALCGHLALLHRVFLTLADNWIFPNPHVQFYFNMWAPANPTGQRLSFCNIMECGQ